MGKINVEALLQPISPEAPSGDDLSYDTAFLELERISQGAPEQQVGSTIIPAQEPVWRDVSDQAVELLARTKHLRVILIASVAALQTEGLTGLRDGLALLRGVLEAQWETVFPRLDPDDNNDPLERMNIIASLAAPPGTFGDPFQFIGRAQAAPLASSRQLGRFSFRDIQVAKGELPPASPDAKVPDLNMLDGAFADTSVEDLQSVLKAAEEGVEHITAIDHFLDEKVGVGAAPDLKAFETALRDIAKAVQAYVVARTGGVAASEGEPSGGGDAAPSRTGGGPLSGEIGSPNDVILALDKICRYYERSELSSPVPLMLKAAKRLVSKSFLDIARIMPPDAIRTVEEMGKEEGSSA